MGFKEDADFARFVSMGAVGTAAVGRYLRDHHGHRPIELERYAMSNKVWQTKVKRLRLPDLVCVQCGRRVESRAKSKLGIVVSHSEQPGRQWNAGGMRPNDLYAFARADLSGDHPAVGRPIFFASAALETSRATAKLSDSKAASEGSEVTLSWPSWVPGKSGVFGGIDSEGRIVCEWDGGGRYRYSQWRRWGGRLFIYVAPGDRFVAGETMLAGTVEPERHLDCPGSIWDIARAVGDDDPTERYAAVKAAGVEGRSDLVGELASLADSETDWRLHLEVLVSLARLDPERWTPAIGDVANTEEGGDEVRMEAVFALGEVPTDAAAAALAEIAGNEAMPSEVRSAAAWGLGRGVHPRADLLLPLTVMDDPLVSLHAIVGLADLPETVVPGLMRWLGSGDDHRAAVAAHVLARHEAVGPLLDAARSGGEGRLWALSALGDLPPDLVRSVAGGELDPATEQELAPLWVGQRDWLRRDDGRDGLEALDVQTVRFDPVDLAD